MSPKFVFVYGHDLDGKGSEKVKEKLLEVIEGSGCPIGLYVTRSFTSNQLKVMNRDYEKASTVFEIAQANEKKMYAKLTRDLFVVDSGPQINL